MSLDLYRLWGAAIRKTVVRHPNHEARPILDLRPDTAPLLVWSIENHRDTRDTRDVKWEAFTLSNIRLTFWPGERLAIAWIAAAWAGYLQHEALELVTVDGENPLDPHRQPYPLNPWNRGLRDGMPPELTPETLVRALAVVMPEDEARRMASEVAP